MSDEVRSAMFKRAVGPGFGRKMGLKLLDVKPGYALVEMVAQKEDTNYFGMIHGGAIFSLMDEAFQASCNSHGTLAVALSMNVVYHCSPEIGGRLQAESNEIQLSKKTGTYDIKVTDEDGRLIASCHALAYRKREKLPFLDK